MVAKSCVTHDVRRGLEAYEEGNQVDSLISAMEGMVEDVYGHVHRVSGTALAVGEVMGLDQTDLDRLSTVGILHDVGKIHVSDALLTKPSALDVDELVSMQQHPLFGFAMTADLFEREVAEAILYHHERFDGAGYPHGLAGTEIPLMARIVSVADAFDAITSTRSYQPALPVEYATREIRIHSGTQFDPEVVEAFLTVEASGILETGPGFVLDLAAG